MSLLMEGVYVTRQVTRDPETVAIARRMIDMLVEKHLPAARKSALTTDEAPFQGAASRSCLSFVSFFRRSALDCVLHSEDCPYWGSQPVASHQREIAREVNRGNSSPVNHSN